MAWSGLNLTVEGRNILNQAQLSGKMNLKAIVIGDGQPPDNFNTAKKLTSQLYEITDFKVAMAEGECTLTADLPRVEYDYYFREVGVIATGEDGDVLYVYDNCGQDAQYIVNTTNTEKTEKRIRLVLKISGVADVTVSTPSILYVDYKTFEKFAESHGRVLIGSSDTPLEKNDTLFVIEDEDDNQKFKGASFTNVVHEAGKAFVHEGGKTFVQSTEGIISGDLTVSDQYQDTVFLAKI